MGSPMLFGIAEVGYFVAMMVYIGYFMFKNKSVGITATALAAGAFLSQTAALILRWVESYGMGIGRAPLTNLYESLIFFVWCLMLGYLIIEFKYKNRTFGAFVTPLAGLALGFIDLTGISKEIEPLVPALQSNWLLAHVTMSFIAYAAFALAFATGMLYLVLSTEKRSESSYIFWTVAGSVFFIVLAAMGADYIKFKVIGTSQELIKGFLFKATFRNESGFIALLSFVAAFALMFFVWRYGYVLKRMVQTFNITLDFLEDLNYKVIAVGFPIFTLGGLIFGAIWADQAWGVYWSWDPKETWSLISWLVYAFYLHARFLRGWRGNKIAVLSSIGFITVIFTYLGVNLFLSGLHSYGEA
ncbi:c-type cytochrome biogenesis protein CcsB [Candidatus Magnetominusculus xianensis]|uniref:Cytochrome C biogenesis protein CcsB n=1 Tax=Candidatus Magnetominusculus xianensis TaxID=1748249 RepID=A0ABR5SDB2_9BACT|nr:c-type cytochrome biogenesis protein CcsB [Candidatus Magnetominusculus xianensis]KWT82942.1 cytochrome C biogenesis protein CcsB [Candidatus Magnetominusculus xianensis]MBF0403021.1 c-type cytochrome biogenesis protein CcsB [Nitrospirota bacterium]